MTDARQVVHEFELGKRGTVRASVGQFRGHRFADLRLWVEIEPGDDLVPTKKGLSVPLEFLDELEAAIAALKGAA
ncbi:MAG: transcriptional coactivator p15/PC4 family protein [Chloroflexi bacterium]|nr:transcriptional coactivator p15/PC4 family protein [Chloroflexota bacterium]